MLLMTKREIKSLLEESKAYGIPVDMPWNYIAKYNKESEKWHMEEIDTDNPHSFDGDMSEILDMYSDLWRMSEDICILFLLTLKMDSSYETLGGTVFMYQHGIITAYNCLSGGHIIKDFEDLRKFFEDD